MVEQTSTESIHNTLERALQSAEESMLVLKRAEKSLNRCFDDRFDHSRLVDMYKRPQFLPGEC